MDETIKKESVKRFVKDILGCNCPEKVFDVIEVEEKIDMPGILTLDYRINIGNRLLIYLLDTTKKTIGIDRLSSLLEKGVQERDDRGFNRFRLVLVGTCENSESSEMVKKALVGKSEGLEKVHIHFLEKERIEDVLT